jgi:hypothetical protein
VGSRGVVALENPYSRTLRWLRADPETRRRVSPQQLSDYRRIEKLPGVWGEELDRLGVTYYQLRWVAGPDARKALLEVEYRYRALVAHLNAGHVGSSAFRTMVEKLAEERAAQAEVRAEG